MFPSCQIGALLATFLLLVPIFAPFSQASQSSISQKSSFNSDRQLGFLIAGNWGLDERSFANASFAYSQTPIQNLDQTDTYYQGTIGLGYALKNIAFDLGFMGSQSPLERIHSLGGSLGLTYIHIPPNANPDDYKNRALTSLHSQVYTEAEELQPVFWVRFGFVGNTIKSNLIDFPANSGKETALTIDAYYPHGDLLLLSAGASFHGYDNSRGFYDRALANITSIEMALLASTLQGLPHTTLSLQAFWQITSRDTFLPRYQSTEIESIRKWSHTLDLGWRHRFSTQWFLAPTYEITAFESRIATAVVLDFLFIF